MILFLTMGAAPLPFIFQFMLTFHEADTIFGRLFWIAVHPPLFFLLHDALLRLPCGGVDHGFERLTLAISTSDGQHPPYNVAKLSTQHNNKE
jgi:hypothetical protein